MTCNHKVKRQDLDFIMRDLNYYALFPGKKFATILNKNRDTVVKLIDETNVKANATKPAEFDEFKHKESVILNKYAYRDEKGNMQYTQNGSVAISEENKEKFEEEIKALQEEYKPHTEKFNAFFQNYKEVLEEEVEFELTYLDEEDLYDGINATQLDKFSVGPEYLRLPKNLI